MVEKMYHFEQGRIPLLISIPHLGSELPLGIEQQLTDVALQTADTDWHLDLLYQFAADMGASILGGRFSRYVIDLNRPASGESLYPGQTTTGLCPEETFRGQPLYRGGSGPKQGAIEERLRTYWRPYHQKLREELDRLTADFGTVLLWEAHSIASVLPRLFKGKLPDLNIGTNGGASCDASILDAITAQLADQPYTWVANGRFKGGYITRAYGQPQRGVSAVQLEMCQSTYMNEHPPFDYRTDLAEKVQVVVQRMVGAALHATERLAK
ncbi:N-formylglutamate deformylase [Paraburkholderia terricola]|uniref:N-formylglutamate deformylase n=1 Tax=Paraburkholderia terricola TaxID=169427 RepID=A0ABU1M027_9BURK|nr:N-formylglutamate deformylase [Paraburkholderia terricola]MDR6412360.1 N-formylglutamate deformylase [Paraburkholderia terricola]MDR6449932.1 N-formylglutamate deformylase [Paraburkholderia terricola]MDR6484575.1 N-formylglutamate deformylase [Paraburkholderia terricola]